MCGRSAREGYSKELRPQQQQCSR
ncbi:hypothetical protein HU200_059049 [Digitaria exilis]|uniref:Uncharacterized protein n=1 Tax=Digitaria exilis TaxID=1010633 RepID=A0A835A8I6_9POAL|nr:hypothetical protein HU200_059049 [Digitaria exilis]